MGIEINFSNKEASFLCNLEKNEIWKYSNIIENLIIKGYRNNNFEICDKSVIESNLKENWNQKKINFKK
jgi:hypothetical protein